GGRAPAVLSALARLHARVAADPEVASVRGEPVLDPSARYALLVAFGKHDYGEPEEQAFAKRLRAKLVPAARFPNGVDVLTGGAPAQCVDFLHQAFTLFPWLILGVLVLTYVLLMRVFRSLLLPLKAVLL